MARPTRSEFTANDALHATVRRIEPRAVEHHRPASNGAVWCVLVILAGTGAGLLAGLFVGLIHRYL
jgi:hypothetical protein